MSETQLTSVLDQLDQLEEVVLDGTRVPFSGGRLVNEQDAIELMDAVRDALPGQLVKADELVAKKDEFIQQARQKADDIVAQAKQQRDQLINSQSIRSEAERQVAELRDQARQQCEQMIAQARQQVAKTEQEHQPETEGRNSLLGQKWITVVEKILIPCRTSSPNLAVQAVTKSDTRKIFRKDLGSKQRNQTKQRYRKQCQSSHKASMAPQTRIILAGSWDWQVFL